MPYDTKAARSMSRVSSFVAACTLSRTCPLRVVAVTPWLWSEAVRYVTCPAGVPAINAAIAGWVSRVIELADEFALAVVSSRDEQERAGIVVLEPPAGQVTYLTASLHNHGVTATTRNGQVRLSVHAATNEETLDMLRAAFVSYGTAASY